jgi:DUF1680 family protein
VVKNGPLVYCLEGNDLPPGVRLADIALSLDPAQRAFSSQRETIVNADVLTLTVPALHQQRAPWQPGQLYREAGPAALRPIEVKLVPYFAWGNRGEADMSVWLPAR